MEKYQPIACSLYDYLELLILKKERVHILTDESEFEDTFINLYTKDKIEYADFKSGRTLRLDVIEKINNLITKEIIHCKL